MQAIFVSRIETPSDPVLRYDSQTMENWLQQAIDASGISQSQLARDMTEALGRSIDRAAINKLLNGKRRFKADELIAVAKITKFPLPNDDVGQFVSSLAQRISAGKDADAFDQVELTRLPLRGEVAAGRWLETPAFLDWSEISDYVDGISVPPSQVKFTYGLIVRGTSVNRVASDGDVLVCLDTSSGVEVHERDLIIVERIRDDGSLREVTAKRLVRRDGQLVLMPESTDPMWQTPIPMEDADHEDTEIRIVAKVKFVIKTV